MADSLMMQVQIVLNVWIVWIKIVPSDKMDRISLNWIALVEWAVVYYLAA